MATLMQLPWEVREQIWIYALQRDCPLRRPEVYLRDNIPITEIISDNVASLICASKELHQESMPIFYRSNDFCPYFSYYLDRRGHCLPPDDTRKEIPTPGEWVERSDTQKHADLGIAAKYMAYLVSLVIYHDGVDGDSFDEYSDRDCQFYARRNFQRHRELIPEMLCWVRQKAPRVRCLSIRYRSYTPRRFYNISPGNVALIPRRATRFYRQVRGFRQLEVLDIRWSYARRAEPLVWGDDAPMKEVPDHAVQYPPSESHEPDNRMVQFRGQFLGDALQRAFVSHWKIFDRVEPRLGSTDNVWVVRCGHRCLFLLRPAQKSSKQSYLAARFVAHKRNISISGLDIPRARGWNMSDLRT